MPRQPSSLQFFQAQAPLQPAQNTSHLLEPYLKPHYELIETEYPKLQAKIPEAVTAVQNILDLSNNSKSNKKTATETFEKNIATVNEFINALKLYNQHIAGTRVFGEYLETLVSQTKTCIMFKNEICAGNPAHYVTNLKDTLSTVESRLLITNADYKANLVLNFYRLFKEQMPAPIIVEKQLCTIV